MVRWWSRFLGHSYPRVYGKSLDESIALSNTTQNGKAFEFTVFVSFGAYYFSQPIQPRHL